MKTRGSSPVSRIIAASSFDPYSKSIYWYSIFLPFFVFLIHRIVITRKMVIKCEAIVNKTGVYFSGQTLDGRICISLDERILVKALALKISGYAQTEWDIAKKGSKTRLVNGREDYIATTTYLLGSEDSTSIMIPVGSYTYNFSCTIPEKSPSSYESPSGYIRYQIRVILEYPNRSDEILTEAFQVVRAYDLRPQALVLKLPLDTEVYESKCCCEYWKTPMCLYVNLSQAGYVPGQTISVYSRLLNEGKIPLGQLEIFLNQVVVYKSRVPLEATKTERYNVVQIVNCLTTKESQTEFLDRIKIPDLLPSCDTDCKVLQVSYEVEVIIVGVKGKRGILVRIPVVIGTIPFVDTNVKCGDIDMKQPLESMPVAIISTGSMEAIPSIPSLSISPSAPSTLSCQEQVFMTTSNAKEDKSSINKNSFQPKYLYYEMNENIEMTPTTMEITKEISIATTKDEV